MLRFVVLLPFNFLGMSIEQDSASSTSPKTVPNWIEQLGSPRFTEREEASKQLKALGYQILPELRKVENHSNPEVQKRIQELISILELQEALEPKRITLDITDQPLVEVWKEIGKQIGYQINTRAISDNRKISITCKNNTFHEAIELLNQKSGSAPLHTPLEPIICIMSDTYVGSLSFPHGRFLTEISSIHEDRKLWFDSSKTGEKQVKRRGDLSLAITIRTEPGTAIVGIEKATIERAEDEKGNPFQIEHPSNIFYNLQYKRIPDIGFVTVFNHQINILLKRPSQESQKIKHIKGSIPIRFVGRRKNVVISENAVNDVGMKFTSSDQALTLTRAETDGKAFLIEISLPPTGNKELDPYWGHRIHVEDKSGIRVRAKHRDHSTLGRTALAFFERPDQKPGTDDTFRFLMEDWKFMEYHIPFEFRDVPLP